MKRFLILLLCTAPFTLSAQEFFQRTYGGPGSEFGRGIVQTQDGGYACVGTTNSFADGSSNVYLIKIDEVGDYVWGRNIGESGTIEWGVDIEEDSEGNLIVAGYSNNTEDGNYDGYIVKLNSLGSILWELTFGGDDWDFLESVFVDLDNSIYVAGNTFREDQQQGWIAHITTSGELDWEELISMEGNLNITGIVLCSDHIFFVGNEEDIALSSRGFFSGSMNQSGEIIWMESFPEWGDIDPGNCRCRNETLYSIGTYYTEDESDFYIVRQDISDGAVQLNLRIESPVNFIGNALDVYDNSEMVITGAGENIFFEGLDAFIVKRDGEGGYISDDFNDTFGQPGNEEFFDVELTNDGGYITIGNTSGFGNNFQIYVAKIGADGSVDDTNEDFLDLATPVQNIVAGINLDIYPNPTTQYLNVNSEYLLSDYYLTDLTGKILVEGQTKKNPERIDLSGFENGIYILRLETENHGWIQSRILKL